jgi:hypothetical protein
MADQPWYELDVQKDDALGEAFFRDYCTCHTGRGLEVHPLHVMETDRAERYLIEPPAVAVYFFDPMRSALADWLRTTGLAHPLRTPPRTEGYRTVTCEADLASRASAAR